MRRSAGLTSSLAILVTLLTLEASANEVATDNFSPTIKWAFCKAEPTDECRGSYRAGANPRLDVVVEQEDGEVDIQDLVVQFPAGYYLAPDHAITHGSLLGRADLTVASGPGCAGGTGTIPFSVEDRPVVERDRSDEEKRRHVRAVWVIEVFPQTSIELELFGGSNRGYTIDHLIPANDFLCPPLRVAVSYHAKTPDDEVLFQHPTTPGTYRLSAVFRSEDDPPQIQRRTQQVTITR